MIKTSISQAENRWVVNAVLTSLGVPEDRWRDVMIMSIQSGYWRVVLGRRDAEDNVILNDNFEKRVATETYEIKIDPYGESEDSTSSS